MVERDWTMRRAGRFLVALLLAAWCATCVARGQDQAALLTNDPKMVARMDAILRRWEAVSQQNETLYTQFVRTDTTKFGTEQVFRGEALFRKPNLACLNWEQILRDDKGNERKVFTERIVCAGDRVYQMIGPTKQVMVYPLPQDERRRALEEGPVPFLFNMRMEQAKARYHWVLLKEQPATGRDPACYYIEIRPKQAIDMEEFSKAWIKLDEASLLPLALQLYAPNGGKDTRTYVFSGVERNGEKNRANNIDNFNGAKMAEQFRKAGYKVIVNSELVDPAQLSQRPGTATNAPAGRGQSRR
jgi:TIGR03009 family protein